MKLGGCSDVKGHLGTVHDDGLGWMLHSHISSDEGWSRNDIDRFYRRTDASLESLPYEWLGLVELGDPRLECFTRKR